MVVAGKVPVAAVYGVVVGRLGFCWFSPAVLPPTVLVGVPTDVPGVLAVDPGIPPVAPTDPCVVVVLLPMLGVSCEMVGLRSVGTSGTRWRRSAVGGCRSHRISERNPLLERLAALRPGPDQHEQRRRGKRGEMNTHRHTSVVSQDYKWRAT